MDVREIVELGSLSAQGLRAWLEADEDERVLVIGDEDSRVEIQASIGKRAAAVQALKDVAGLVLAWAAELERTPVPERPAPGQPGIEGWT